MLIRTVFPNLCKYMVLSLRFIVSSSNHGNNYISVHCWPPFMQWQRQEYHLPKFHTVPPGFVFVVFQTITYKIVGPTRFLWFFEHSCPPPPLSMLVLLPKHDLCVPATKAADIVSINIDLGGRGTKMCFFEGGFNNFVSDCLRIGIPWKHFSLVILSS